MKRAENAKDGNHMKTIWKRIFLFCVMVFAIWIFPRGIAGEAAQPDGEVYFIAAGDRVLPVSGNAMPFFDGGYVYISSAVFTDERAQDALDISRVRDQSRGLLSLYGGKGSLVYTLGGHYATGDDGDFYAPGMIQRSGEYYVPAMVIARYFGLLYSEISVEHGTLIWMRKEDFRVDERLFLDVAYEQIQTRYEEYLRSREPGPDPEPPVLPETESESGPEPPDVSDTPSPRTPILPDYIIHAVTPAPTEAATPFPSATLTPSPSPTPEPLAGNRDLYLCARADGESAGDLLDFLDRLSGDSDGLNPNQERKAPAPTVTVFCGSDFLREYGDLSRGIAASGYAIGLIADGGGRNGEEENPLPRILENLREDNRILKETAGIKTRLVLLENAGHLAANYEMPDARDNLYNNILLYHTDGGGALSKQEIRRIMREAGFVCYMPDASYSVRTAYQARETLRAVSRGSGAAVPVWLGGGVSVTGLSAFFTASAGIGDRCLPLDEIICSGFS